MCRERCRIHSIDYFWDSVLGTVHSMDYFGTVCREQCIYGLFLGQCAGYSALYRLIVGQCEGTVHSMDYFWDSVQVVQCRMHSMEPNEAHPTSYIHYTAVNSTPHQLSEMPRRDPEKNI